MLKFTGYIEKMRNILAIIIITIIIRGANIRSLMMA